MSEESRDFDRHSRFSGDSITQKIANARSGKKALFIHGEAEEMKIENGDISSLEGYSDKGELPERELEQTVEIIGDRDIDPRRLAGKMRRVKQHVDTLKRLQRLAKESRMFADYQRIKKKLGQVEKYVRCLTANELRELKKLQVFSSPYNEDMMELMDQEISKAEAVEKKRKARRKGRRGQSSQANIDNEMRKMAFLMGIYGASGQTERHEYVSRASVLKKKRGHSSPHKSRASMMDQHMTIQPKELPRPNIYSQSSEQSIMTEDSVPVAFSKPARLKNVSIGGMSRMSRVRSDDSARQVSIRY